MLGDVRCIPLLKIISLSFIPCCIHACINGCYYGQKKTGVPALTQLTEQIARVGTVWLLYQIHMREQTAVPLSVTMWGAVMGEVASTLGLRQRRKTSGGNGHGAFREMRHAQPPCHGGSAHGKPGLF